MNNKNMLFFNHPKTNILIKSKKNMRFKNRNQNQRASVTVPIGIAIILMIGIILTAILVPLLVSGSDPLDALELQTTPWTCPSLEFSYEPSGGPNDEDNTEFHIQWYNATTLYYFRINDSSMGEMVAVKYDENRTNVVSSSGNLFQVPWPHGNFQVVTYYPKNDTFLVVTRINNDSPGDGTYLYQFTPQGNQITAPGVLIIDSEMNEYVPVSLFFDDNDNFYVNTRRISADVEGASSMRLINLNTGVVGPSIPFTLELGYLIREQYAATRNPADGKIYIIRDTKEAVSSGGGGRQYTSVIGRMGGGFQYTSVIGRINLETSVVESTCMSPYDPIYIDFDIVSLTFDIDGVAWIVFGEDASAPWIPYNIYKFTNPFETGVAAQTFNLLCTDSIVTNIGDTTVYSNPTFTTTGIGCLLGDGQIRVVNVTHLENTTAPALLTISTKKSELMNGKRSQSLQNVSTCVNMQHVMHPQLNYSHTLMHDMKRRNISYTPESIYGTTTIGGGDTFSIGTNNGGDPSVGSDIFKLPDGTQVRNFRMIQRPNDNLQLVEYFNFTQRPEEISIRPTLDINANIMGDCIGFDSQIALKVDHEAQRVISVWTANSRQKLCVLNTNLLLGDLFLYEFDFSGDSIEKMDFTIWGDYYQVCWNNVASMNPWSKCHIIERERILNSVLGMPRIITLPDPTIVSSGAKATSYSLHREYDPADIRGPLVNNFPCGVFVSMTANSGGQLNLKLCQSIDFDTTMVSAIDSITAIGTYDDGSSGSCPSETQCITTDNAQLDPNRYDVSSAYQRLGSQERLGIAITVGADGVGDSKILTGTFTIDGSMGTLTSDGNLQIYDPNSLDQYGPAVTFDNAGTLWLIYREFDTSSSVARTHIAFIFLNTIAIQRDLGNSLNQQIAVPSTAQGANAVRHRRPIPFPGTQKTVAYDNPVVFCSPSTCFWKSSLIPHAFTPLQKFGTKFFASDDCNQFATCTSTVEYQ